MRSNLGFILFVALKVFVIFGQELSEKDYDTMKISIDESELPKNATENEYKAILRYGFQHTGECQNFPKAFLCIKKCLDFGYQIAESDKKCQCRCYKNKVLAAYKPTGYTSVAPWMWSFTAPTTSVPRWAQIKLNIFDVKPKDGVELFADSQSDSEEHDKLHGSGSGDSSDDKSEDDHESGSGSEGEETTTGVSSKTGNENITTLSTNETTTLATNETTTLATNETTTLATNETTTLATNETTTLATNETTTLTTSSV